VWPLNEVGYFKITLSRVIFTSGTSCKYLAGATTCARTCILAIYVSHGKLGIGDVEEGVK